MNKQRAYVQLISKLLGVEFDAIWQRHKRQLIQKAIAWTMGILVVLAALTGVWLTNQPVDVEMQLHEASAPNPNLPPLHDAVVTLTLDNETKTDTIHTMDATTIFKNIPHRYVNKEVTARVECQDFLPLDTTVMLTKAVTLSLYRDASVYGELRYLLWNPNTEQTAIGTEIDIDGHKVRSDTNGYVQLTLPLSEQKAIYPVSSVSLSLQTKEVVMPCGPDAAIIFN